MTRPLFGRLRSWITDQLQGYDETHVDLDADGEEPPLRVVFGFDGSLNNDTAVAVSVTGRELFKVLPHMPFVPRPIPACVFCPEPATEEIFLGWEFSEGRAPGPLERHIYGIAPDANLGVVARFAQVCANHVGHSRFTRSNRPVDEL